MPPPGCGLRTSTKYWPVQLMVTVMIASWELIPVAPPAPTPVTPPVVAEGVNVMVTVATANLVGSELLVALTPTVAGPVLLPGLCKDRWISSRHFPHPERFMRWNA